jgi:hypothetical protein
MEKPESCHVGIEVDGYYTGLSKQQMDFQDALAELVDNAISANITSEDYFEEENPDESFDVQINVVRNKDNTVDIIVADSGEGIDPETLSSHIWKSGDRTRAGGILNEHGFGLKNSLSVLTKNEGEEPFKIVSRNSEYENDEFAVVKGPISRSMSIEYVKDSDIWEEGADTLRGASTGTRVHLKTEMDVVKSAYRRGKHLKPLMKALREHFGVIYRQYLEHTSKNKIKILWRDKNQAIKGEYEVVPIFPEFREGQDQNGEDWYRESTIEIEHEGEVYNVEFRRGIVNWEETRSKYERDRYESIATEGSTDSPFRIYYKKNQTTQGVDIVYKGRTLSTNVIDKIYGEKVTKNNRFNDFVGELIITDDEFETVNNKVDVNESNELWVNLKEKIQQNEKYHPRPFGKDEKEKSIKNKLACKLRSETATKTVKTEKGFNGVPIDILQEFEEDYEYLYEVKRKKGEPQHVYQCIMYWDVYKRNKDGDIRKAVLIADGISDNARSMIERWNDREDYEGDNYEVEFQDLQEKDIDTH